MTPFLPAETVATPFVNVTVVVDPNVVVTQALLTTDGLKVPIELAPPK
jgi:hypothetical protein